MKQMHEEFKFTGGHWLTAKKGKNTRVMTRGSKGEVLIADVFAPEDSVKNEDKYNARLIASAPEMLGQLKSYIDYCEKVPDRTICNKFYSSFKGAVARATSIYRISQDTGDKYFDVWKAKYKRMEEYTTEKELKYTKGNWKICSNRVYTTDKDDPICYVATAKGKEKSKANARLISQAPNLLITLYLCEDYFNDLIRQQGGLRPYEYEMRKIITQAIKKATK